MCGNDYCKGCKPDEHVRSFAKGLRHTAPRFGDNAQRRVAIMKRSEVFVKLKASGENVSHWPEQQVADYGQGKIHFLPELDHIWLRDQVSQSIKSRAAFFQSMLTTGNPIVVEWPEYSDWLKRAAEMAHTRISEQNLSVDISLHQVEAILNQNKAEFVMAGYPRVLPSYLRKPSSDASAKAKAKWKRSIRNFQRRHGLEYENVVNNLTSFVVGLCNVSIQQSRAA